MLKKVTSSSITAFLVKLNATTMIRFLFLPLFFLIACTIQTPQLLDTQAEPVSVEIIDLDLLEIDKTKTSIYISKSKYQISLMEDEKVLKTWSMVLGYNPEDDKLMQGDRCTPEGHFKVRDLYPHKAWSKFIWIDYPNTESRKKHTKAKADGLIPEDASIGGEVGIHGVPDVGDQWVADGDNWTYGCVSLKNQDVNELYKYIQVGTPIFIEK